MIRKLVFHHQLYVGLEGVADFLIRWINEWFVIVPVHLEKKAFNKEEKHTQTDDKNDRL
jgi:hypothetical protein